MKIGTGHSLPRLLALALAIMLPLALVTAIPGTASATGCNTVASYSWSGNCTVESGDASNFVEAVQVALIEYSRLRSYPTCDPNTESGRFGTATVDAVDCFQSHTGLQVDGIVGPDTWGKMQSFLQQQECDGLWCYF